MAAAGLEPAGEDGGWLQEVPGCGWNVLGRLPGRGPLADRAVVVGAHYDHLGPALFGLRGAYWGADDNAAAVAILLDLARTLPRGLEGRQVLFAAFDGEEPPHFLSQTMGSMRYVAHPIVPLDRTDLMICMDLVGHALGPPSFPPEVRQSLFVLGAERSAGTGALVEAAGDRVSGVVPRRLGIDVIPDMSDYHAFQEAGVPCVFLTCGRWEHYHKVSDTPEKLDYPKIVATADFLRALTEGALARPEAPVVYEPLARDDAASLRSLRDVGRALAPQVPMVGRALGIVEAMLDLAERGELSREAASQISTLVAQLESILG
jgi:hypothetical protein